MSEDKLCDVLDIIDYALKNNVIVQIVEINDEPYKGYMGIDINGIVLGPFGWECFEGETDDIDKINNIRNMIDFIETL